MKVYAVRNQENGYVYGPFAANSIYETLNAFARVYGYKDSAELVEKEGANHYVVFELDLLYTVENGRMVLAKTNERNDRVVQWAVSRQLIQLDPQIMASNLRETSWWLSDAVARKRKTAAVEAIGDMAATLAILAAQLGTTLEVCQDTAWEQIKKSTADGVFVKKENT